jgi:endogenous inhibitor of DNA gyrase (YacG/DUF329 family)
MTIKNWIECNLFSKNGKMNNRKMSKISKNSSISWIEFHHPKQYIEIMNFGGLDIKENVYIIMKDLVSRPVCKLCQKPVKFIDRQEGFRTYCSTKCLNSDPDMIARSRKSKIERNTEPSRLDNYKKTMLSKYGVEFSFQSEKIVEKIKATNQERYGVDYVLQSKEISEKSKKTYFEKTGFKNPANNPEVIEKMLETRSNTPTGLLTIPFKKYENILYQGKNELKFLESLTDKHLCVIERGPVLKYKIDGKIKRYLPDFVIGNVLYEIKSYWTWDNYTNKKLRVVNKLKLRAAKKSGYDVRLVVDGDEYHYSEIVKRKKLK